jgi:hypothetical protein
MGNRSSLRRSNHDPVSTAYLWPGRKYKKNTHENVARIVILNERRGGWVWTASAVHVHLPVLRVRDNEGGRSVELDDLMSR